MAGRTMHAVLVKRTNPRWLDWYGHWWVELGQESYGWWPDRRPVGVVAALRGVAGRLNGVGGVPGGSSTRDPRHGEPADHAFHPEVLDGRSDDEVVAVVRTYAASHGGEWRLSWSGQSGNCRTFQYGLLTAAGLSEPSGYQHTRGGCPFVTCTRRVTASVRAAMRQPKPASDVPLNTRQGITDGTCRRLARHAVVLFTTMGDVMTEILGRSRPGGACSLDRAARRCRAG